MSGKYFLLLVAYFGCAAFAVGLASVMLQFSVVDELRSFAGVSVSLLIIGLTFRLTKKFYLRGKIDPANKAVFITGCDTGFGHLLARKLDTEGYFVFAGCLFNSGPGATHLKESCSDRLKTVEVDVTKDHSVNSALNFVKENLGENELWAVVNNAGIAKGWGVEFSTLDDFKDSMEVNAFGMLRVTKAFLPLIRRSKGRIVNITSDAARVQVPHITPYCMSKFAAGGFSDCLRQEVSGLGVKVISVEPEMFRTPMTSPESINKRFDSMLSTIDDEVKSGYGKKYLTNLKHFKNLYLKTTSPNVHIVIRDLESAICKVHPASIYKPRGSWLSGSIILIYQVMPADVQDFLFGIFSFLSVTFMGLSAEINNISRFVD